MICWKFWGHMNRNSSKTGQEIFWPDWLIQSQGSGWKHYTLWPQFTRHTKKVRSKTEFRLNCSLLSPSVRCSRELLGAGFSRSYILYLNLTLSLCIVSRPVTVLWTWTTWMAGWRSSIQTDWSACTGRSGSSLPWAFPSQPRYNRLLIPQTNSTDKPLS